MRFRLVVYETSESNKFMAEERHEYLGDRNAIWKLWFMLVKQLNKRHVEVYSLDGTRQKPENGLAGMTDYSV